MHCANFHRSPSALKFRPSSLFPLTTPVYKVQSHSEYSSISKVACVMVQEPPPRLVLGSTPQFGSIPLRSILSPPSTNQFSRSSRPRKEIAKITPTMAVL